MPKIKLKEWADKHNLSYLTANRHFHAGMIPGAMQLDSGTILVEDESTEQNMAGNTSNEAMSLFLKKTVEFSKSNSTVEDFAAFVISNFQLKLNGVSDNPRYSKNKPKTEEVQKHFQQFLPDPKDVEHLKTVKSLIKEGKTAGEIVPAAMAEQTAQLSEVLGNAPPFERVSPIKEYPPADEVNGWLEILSKSATNLETSTEGLVKRSVDCNTTPQQINYTGSTSQPFSGSFSPTITSNSMVDGSVNGDLGGSLVTSTVSAYAQAAAAAPGLMYFNNVPQSPFQPTQKELLSSAQVIETAETEDAPRKRGRKPSKKR